MVETAQEREIVGERRDEMPAHNAVALSMVRHLGNDGASPSDV